MVACVKGGADMSKVQNWPAARLCAHYVHILLFEQ
jgi:hypothetical protein